LGGWETSLFDHLVRTGRDHANEFGAAGFDATIQLLHRTLHRCLKNSLSVVNIWAFIFWKICSPFIVRAAASPSLSQVEDLIPAAEECLLPGIIPGQK
jgi:hypothetical protein